MDFGEKLSIAAFKDMLHTDKIDVVRSPLTDKLFMSANGKTVGAVSTKYDSTKDKEVVQMLLEEGKTLWCLHNPSTVNVIETL